MTEFPLDPRQHPDLTDFIAELNKANVDYLVVGAWAVMAHSRSLRATKPSTSMSTLPRRTSLA
jgi:hypothetical protein